MDGKTFFVTTYASRSPIPNYMNTMASGEVLRATSPSAILKLALQTGSSRRCPVQNFKHKQGKACVLLLASVALVALPAVGAKVATPDPPLRPSSRSSAWREFGGAIAPGAL